MFGRELFHAIPAATYAKVAGQSTLRPVPRSAPAAPPQPANVVS
jgi:hypothetical protein